MDYRIDEIKIEPRTEKHSEYVSLTLMNPDDEWDEPFVVPVWNEKLIERYKALLASPEVAGDVTKLPEAKRTFKYGFWEKVDLPCPMNRVYSNDLTVTRVVNGVPQVIEHKAGSLLCDRFGSPVLYTSIMVFTKKHLDNNTGQLEYAKGWDLVSRANQIIARQFVLPKQGGTATDVTPENVIPAPQAPVAPAPINVQPTPTPVQAPQPMQAPQVQVQPTPTIELPY